MKLLLLTTLAAFSFAVDTVNPVSQELQKMSAEAKSVMDSYRSQIQELRTVPGSNDQIKSLYAQMKSEIEIINNKKRELIKAQGITIKDIKESPKYAERQAEMKKRKAEHKANAATKGGQK